MRDGMTSRERLMAALRHEPLDRVPISTHELVGWNPDSWENQEPSYQRLMDFIRAHTDCLYLCSAPRRNRLEETTQETWDEGGSHWTRTYVHTPLGDLRMTSRRDDGVHTNWRVERLLKTDEDIARYLSIPYELEPPDMSGFHAAQERLGERGIMLFSVADPLCVVAELFHFQDFLLRAFYQTEQIITLLDAVAPRVYEFLDAVLAQGAGPLIRIVGPEYATPPYLPPYFFRRFVVEYDRPMIERIHEYGRYARIHCHGRIRHVLDMIVEMGADALDPVEEPPSGDIPLAEVKARCGDRLCLMGNLQLRDLETGAPEQMAEIVRETISAGKPGGGFVIMPAAAPINAPLSPLTERNYIAFIETALRYGRY